MFLLVVITQVKAGLLEVFFRLILIKICLMIVWLVKMRLLLLMVF